MPWQLVGIGRKAAPALDPSDTEYLAFWRTTLALATRAVTNPDETQHLLSQLPDHEPLRRYPNCALFGTVGGRGPNTFAQCAFLYAAPFVDVVTNWPVFKHALTTISLPRVGANESWYPVAFEALHDDADRVGGGERHYRIYKTLVLRIALLLRCMKTVYMKRTVEFVNDATMRAHFGRIEQQMYHWLDAHLLMIIQIHELGHVPYDESPEMYVLLQRYPPDVHMAFSEADMPDLSDEISRSAFFTQSSGARKEDPFIATFTKALPHRCEVREVAVKVAEVSAYNAGYFGFIKIALAALFLGIDSHANYRGGFMLRFAVYRLFFSTMDRRLLPFRTPRRASDGSALPLGGSAASMAHEYNLHNLCEAVLSPLSPTRRQRAVSANTRLQHTNYTAIVAIKYQTTLEASRKQTGAKKKSATQMRAEAMRHWRGNYMPPAAASTNSAKVDDIETRLPDNIASATELAQSGILDPVVANSTPDAFCQGLFVSNAMTRMTYEKNCGQDYYDQRLAAGTLPSSGIVLRDGTSPPPPKPAEHGTTITYKDAFKGVLACDRELPSEEALQRDAIIYHWISTLLLRDKDVAVKKTTGKRKTMPVIDDSDSEDEKEDSDSDDEEDDKKQKKPREKTTEREYVFQNAINLAVRSYLIFALRRWLEPLRHELCSRVSWASWEESVAIFADGLRNRLDALYVVPRPLGAFLTSFSAYQWMTNAARSRPINNHYTSERESFIATLKRLMKTKVNNGGYGDRRVDAVVPRETEILILHLLQHWRYARIAPPLNFAAVPRHQQTSTASTSSTAVPVFEQFTEKIVTPQLVYLIEPVAVQPLPSTISPDDAVAVRAHIKTEYVDRGLFPLGIFHAHKDVLDRFAKCRTAYHLSPSDPVVREFVDWLADYSAYQFFLLRTYARVVERYMEIHTEPLPRHIVEKQLDTLRRQYCIPPDVTPPPHLMRSLVCFGCKRCASVFPTATQRHSAMAVGNDEVRFVGRTDDDEVFDHVRKRGFLPLPFSALRGADSWTEVLQHRSQPAAEVYDRYCNERDVTPEELARRSFPQPDFEMPVVPTADHLTDYARALFADTFSDESRAARANPTDRRRLVYTDEHPDPRERPLQLVARGKGRLGEMEFDESLWREFDRRMRIYDGGGPDGDRSFLLLGHSIEGADTSNYGEIKWCDTTQKIKLESKKAKQSSTQLAVIMANTNQAVKKRKLAAHYAKLRRDAEAMARFAMCARRRMVEIDFLGNALRATNLYVTGRVHADENDCILACTDCVVRIWSSQARVIGDRVVCPQCYTASKHSGGSVAQRTIRGESTKSISSATLSMLDSSSASRTRSSALQTQLSPSYSALCSEVVPLGTCCAMDNCQTFKTDQQKMVGLQVVRDDFVGNETCAYIYFCAKHARMYARLFRVVTILPFSTIKLFMMQGRRDFMEIVSRGSYLDDVMRRAAHASGIGAQARAEEEQRREKKSTAAAQRKQRQLAAAEALRQRDSASSALVKK